MQELNSNSTATVTKEDTSPKKLVLPLWNVVLIDDNFHTFEYVISMLRNLFGHSETAGFKMAKEVDLVGRAIVLSTHRERAELERNRIIGYGADPLIPQCKGSMNAIIEPAPGA